MKSSDIDTVMDVVLEGAKALSSYFWSKNEEELLKKAYKEGEGLREAERLFPDRNRSTIAAKASRLGITTPRPRKPK